MAPQPRILAAPRDDFALAFVNTRYWRGRAQPSETLAGPADLSSWWQAETAEVLPEPDPPAFAEALRLRECLHRLFAACADGRHPAREDIADFNAALESNPPPNGLAWAGDRLAWLAHVPPCWTDARARLQWSAADLLTGPRGPRVRQCDNPDCRYLFLDSSKAGTRRWCDMASCGNRAKAHRHYQRHKDAAGP